MITFPNHSKCRFEVLSIVSFEDHYYFIVYNMLCARERDVNVRGCTTFSVSNHMIDVSHMSHVS